MYIHSVTEDGKVGELAALDLRTGKVSWVQKWTDADYPFTEVRAVHGTLFTRETTMEGVRVLCAFDGATGRQRWRFEEPGAALPPDTGPVAVLPPSVVDGIVYDNENPLYVLDAHTGKKLWEQRTFAQECYFSHLFIHKGIVYADTCEGVAGDYPPEFYCIFAFEAKTGNLLWQSEPGCELVDVREEESLVLERVVSSQREMGQHLILQARATFDRMLRWRVTVRQRPPYSAQVHSAEKKLYVLDNGQPGALQVFDLGSGQQLARHVLSLPPNEFIKRSRLSDGMLYIHSCESFVRGRDQLHAICAIRLSDGSMIWRYEIGSLKSFREPISEVLLAP
jgi:outer membrane protein assembly factor BamB